MREEASRGDGHPMPNSLHYVFPMIAAPEAFSGWMAVASKGELKVFNDENKAKGRSAFAHRDSGQEVSIHLLQSMAEEHVVGMFLARMLSLLTAVMRYRSAVPVKRRWGYPGRRIRAH